MKAIFLDRDGVLNKLIIRGGKAQAPYTREEFELLPGVELACQKLEEAGFLRIVVTNQPDVARGWVTIESVEMINAEIKKHLRIDDIVVCFHTNSDNCHCRKPLPGMLLAAAQKWEIDLSASYMIGDRYGDISAGVSAGCQTFLVGEGDVQGIHPDPHHKVASLLEAATIILESV